MSFDKFPEIYCPLTGEGCSRCTNHLSAYIINRIKTEQPHLPANKAVLVEHGIKQTKILQEAEPRGVDVA